MDHLDPFGPTYSHEQISPVTRRCAVAPLRMVSFRRRGLALALAVCGAAAFAAPPAWWRSSRVLREVKSKSELETTWGGVGDCEHLGFMDVFS